MSVILIFMAGIAVIITWWMAQQRLTSKPWLEVGRAGDVPDGSSSAPATEKIGLYVFLAVVGALFSLLISAYFMRMDTADWWSVPIPNLLWVNTAALAASSVALHWTKAETRENRGEATRVALLAALATAVLFLIGQVLAWRELAAAGYLLTNNPANSFFYMITGLHGLHIIGGLAVLSRTTWKAWNGAEPSGLRLSVELCAIYWHFMLLVWLILFALFAGWANDFIDICRQLLT
ncbi:cytochrome C oxidase [Paramesorhizobium deserti]|uniref:Cytochrome C oxidase n=1 Tax=Paramesorhizobium deserti TaxID=1494590 RepID=A0A135I129_9HYPH|nr:cytochrome c oxidase subunit 3 [Paramesorhizobium deserti]KXF79154.1 cytochrome C oxidase [Paramesorhizobium deserti]